MKILFIAPFPPPFNGQSLTSGVYFDHLEKTKHEINQVDMVKHSHEDGGGGVKRFLEVLSMLTKVKNYKSGNDLILFHLSMSILGNLKDLLIFFILRNHLEKIYVFSHGCMLKADVYDKSSLLNRLNKYFLSKTSGAIVTGESHLPMFEGKIEKAKMHIVPNFAEDNIYANESIIRKKFSNTAPLKIVYLSNLLPGKGYTYLLDAFISLDDSLKNKVALEFAGGFDTDEAKAIFLDRIKSYKQVKYLGFIGGDAKKELLHRSHVLCFPSFLLEGQGICLLEAYAAGCVVVTTGNNGIGDVFQPDVNGYKIVEKSSESIKTTIEQILQTPNEQLLDFALNNFAEAEDKYKVRNFIHSLNTILQI